METKDCEIVCKIHGLTTHRLHKDRNKLRYRCLKCKVEYTQSRRDSLKLKAIEYKGGKCEVCGYDKCVKALEFHHKELSKKLFEVSEGYRHKWIEVQQELDKCLILCANCHREIHS